MRLAQELEGELRNVDSISVAKVSRSSSAFDGTIVLGIWKSCEASAASQWHRDGVPVPIAGGSSILGIGGLCRLLEEQRYLKPRRRVDLFCLPFSTGTVLSIT
jgi:hypothetical protein